MFLDGAALLAAARQAAKLFIPGNALHNEAITRRWVEESEVVVAIWPDGDQPDGFGLGVIKGLDLVIRHVEAAAASPAARVVPVPTEEHAIVLRRDLGDGRTMN